MEDEETTTEQETFEIEGKHVTRDELVNGYKFANANHERAEANRREREAIETERKRFQEERQAWLNERNAQAKVNEQMVNTLRGFAPKDKEPDDTPYPVLDRLGSIDYLGDTDAGKKVAAEVSAALDDREERVAKRLQAQHKRDLDELKATFQAQLAKEVGKVRNQVSLEGAREKAQRENEELFQRTLKEKYGDTALSSEDTADVRKYFYAQVSPEFGSFDNNGQWRYKADAVDSAIWASPAGRKAMLARETAGARKETLLKRVQGESATASTPTRASRQTSSGDDALIAKIERYSQGLRAKIFTQEQVQAAFSDNEMKRYRELRSQARQEYAEGA